MGNVDVNELRGYFIDKIDNKVLMDIVEEFSVIKSIVGFNDKVENVIKKYVDGLLKKRELNKRIIEINKQIHQLDKFCNDLKNEKIIEFRKNGKLESYLNLLNDNEINKIIELGLIKGEEGSEVKLRRFKEKRDKIEL